MMYGCPTQVDRLYLHFSLYQSCEALVRRLRIRLIESAVKFLTALR